MSVEMPYIYGVLACILLGTNIKPRLAHLQTAIAALTMSGAPLKVSHVYETEPWQMPEGTPWFLNQCILIETPFTAEALLKNCLEIEKRMGRERNGLVESRTIDLDILLYGNDVINISGLHVPHPRLELRRFALLPLSEVGGETLHPILNVTINELLERCADTTVVKPYAAAV